MTIIIRLTLLFLFLFSTPSYSSDSPWIGTVVSITDGDTIKVMHEGKAEKIRLYGIDTPEKSQAFGKRAKQFTSDMVFKQSVKVVPMDRDRYGRTVAMVYLQNSSESLNEALVTSGHAWVYRKYCLAKFCSEWLELESVAMDKKVGLWADKNPIPPWEFRKRR